MYGKLTLITGCMFAGKTTELLRRVLWARNGENKRALVVKPAFDVRYGEQEIKTHDGLGVQALGVTTWGEAAYEASLAEIIFIDEAQFFEAPYFSGDLVDEIRRLLSQGKDVVANGLDMDWKGQPFRVTADLGAMADEIIKRTAFCTECGRPASKSLKKDESTKFVLGASDLYEARCNQHWG